MNRRKEALSIGKSMHSLVMRRAAIDVKLFSVYSPVLDFHPEVKAP